MFSSSIKRKVAIIVGMNINEFNKNTNIIQQKLKGLRSFMGGVFKKMALGVAGLGTVFVLLAKKIFDVGRQFESFRVSLKVLFKDAKKAEDVFAWIKDFAIITPFELPELVQATILLKAFGLEAKDVLQDIGDLAAGMQKDLMFVVDAFGRLRAGQTGEALEKLRRLGIGRGKLQEMGIDFGKGGQLADKTEEGLIRTLGAVQTIIRRDFPNLMVDQSKTVNGIMSNIADATTQIFATIAERIFPPIKKDLTDLLDIIMGAVRSGRVKEIVEEYGLVFDKVYLAFRKNLPEIIEWVKAAALAVWDGLKFLWEYKEEIFIVIAFTKVLTIVKEITVLLKALGAISGLGALFKSIGVAAGATSAGAFAGAGALATAPFAAMFYSAYKQNEKKQAEFTEVAQRYINETDPNELVKIVDEARKLENKWFDAETKALATAEINRMTLNQGMDGAPSIMTERGMDVPTIERVLTPEIKAEREELVKYTAGVRDLIAAKTEIPNFTGDKLGSEKSEAELKLEKDLFLQKLGLLDEFNTLRVKAEQDYLLGIEAINTSTIVNNEEDREALKQRLKEKLDNDIADALESTRGLSDAEIEIEKLKLDQKIGLLNEWEEALLDNKIWALETAQEIIDSTLLTEEEKYAKLLELKVRSNAKIAKIDADRAKAEAEETKKELKFKAVVSNLMYGMEANYVNKRMNLAQAAAASIIQITGDEVKGILAEKAAEWAAKAVAAAASGNFWSAAKFTAAVGLAGVGIALVGEAQRSLISQLGDQDNAVDELDDDVIQSENDINSTGDRTIGAISTRGINNVYISPSVSFHGETIIIGDTSLEVASEAIGTIALNKVIEAVETGELSIA